MNAIGRDWTSLSPELVCTIARKFVDVSYFIRFRAVCKTWRSVTSIADLSPQFPWLRDYTMEPYLHFHSIALKKSFTIPAPKLSNDDDFLACHCLMFVLSSSSKLPWSLINPLNNKVVSLPSMKDIFIELIGCPSYQSRDYVVVQGDKHLHVFKLGDDKWIDMERKDREIYFHSKNLLFIFDVSSKFTKVINLSTQETVSVVPPPQNTIWNWYKFLDYRTLIESNGEVFLVTCAYEFKKFEICRLEVGNGQGNPRWVEATNIGDRILFIDFEKRSADFSLNASDFNGLNLKGNCIFYIKLDQELLASGIINYFYAAVKYDIESATTEVLYTDPLHGFTWYLPALNHI